MVWWVPQLGCPAEFKVPVADVAEGRRVMGMLADYDLFQYGNNIKPDYANMGGLSRWESGEWIDVEDEYDE